MERITLFCLPFAGGSRFSYREYERFLPAFICLAPLEYPGRGSRKDKPLLRSIDLLVDDLFDQIKEQLNDGSYAIYGHSLGGLTGYLLTRRIIDEGYRPPLHVFITGTSGPSSAGRESKKRHLLEKPAFIEEIRKLNGSPEEVLQDDNLLDYFEPILRADFQISETYVYRPFAPLQVPFTVITGTQEEMTLDEVRLWQKETSERIDFSRIPGNHFFIYQHPDKVVNKIAQKLFEYIKLFSHE